MVDFKKTHSLSLGLVFLGILLFSLSFTFKFLGIFPKKQASVFGQRHTAEQILINAASATSTGNWRLIKDFRNTVCRVDSVSATGTVRFVQALSETFPSTTIARSPTNSFEYIEIVDLQSGDPIDGDTGISLTGTTDTRLIEINTNLATWLSAELTPYTTGTAITGNVTVGCVMGDNQ